MEVEAAGFEIRGEAEIMKAAKAPRHSLCQLDESVDGLDRCVGKPGFHVGQDACKVAFDGAGQFAEGQEPRAPRPAQPPLERVRILSGEDVLQGVAQRHRPAQFRIALAEPPAELLLLFGARPGVAPQRPKSPAHFDPLPAQRFAHLIQCLPRQFHDMEVIEDDAGLGKGVLRPADVGRTHVHDDLGDLLRARPVRSHGTGEFGEGLSAAALDHQEQIVAFGIQHHRHVAVAAPRAGFIDHDPRDARPVLFPVRLHHVMIEHPPEPRVVLLEVPGRRRDRHLLAKQEDHRLHHQRKTAAGARPRRRRQQNPVLLASDPGHSGDELGAVLPEIQVPPGFFHRVMDRAKLAALRAGKSQSRLEIQPQLQPARLHVDLTSDHFPCVAQAQCLAEKNVCVHAPLIAKSPCLRKARAHPDGGPLMFPPNAPAASGAGFGGA